ncbi:MAG TPA: FAD-dependent oxidoreductase [Bacteroidales bacterium]|jgi:heterodisulfide reductase subunit A|nr:FAD-dependent oxidoreductase [Bacteroidales bacterium]
MKGSVIVVGGGTAGMEAAGRLAEEGFSVTLIEKEKELGGHLREWHHLFPDRRPGSEVMSYLKKRIEKVNVITGTTVESFHKKGREFIVSTGNGNSIHGDAMLLTTGFDLFRSERKEEYGYGIYENVITSADLEMMFTKKSVRLKNGEKPERIGLLHCVGSRDEKAGNLYCSKLCCVTAVKQAIELRETLGDSKVFCFYMDMRMGGALYEELYREAQEKYGIGFIRGKISEVSTNINNRLVVKAEDTLAGRPLRMELDMLVLMAGMEMSQTGTRLAESGNLKTGENRFFAPADHHFGSNKSNVKGIFYAGTCTAPMNITETISHARSAAADIAGYLKNSK